jgi:molybdopterin-biosynthesis enzyme MoeA-like protein
VRVEVLCTGNELLNGLTVDTNSPWFMDQLSGLGQPVSQLIVLRIRTDGEPICFTTLH